MQDITIQPLQYTTHNRLCISKTKVWIYHCQTHLRENWNMFRHILRDASSSVFEAQSLTYSGKAIGNVWKICPQEIPQVIRLSLGAAPLRKV